MVRRREYYMEIRKTYSLVKALLKLNGGMKNMKLSELSTSSGRTMWLMTIASIVAAFWGFIPAGLAAKIAVILASVYMVYRTIAPALEALAAKTKSPKDDAILAELAADVKFLTDKFGTPKDVAASNGTDNVKSAHQ